MVLRGDYGAHLGVVGEYALLVNGLYRVEIHNSGADALGGENIRRGERACDHEPRGEYRRVRALAQDDRLAGDERGALIGYIVRAGTGQADVYRTLYLSCGAHGLVRLGGVARGEHRHAGELAHERDVLKRLVGAAVLADGETRVREGELHVRAGIGDGVSDLLERSARAEDGEGAGERHVAGECEPGGGADHVRLGDAEVIKSAGEGLLEGAGLGRAREVSVHDDDLFILFAQRGQSLAVCFSCRFTHQCTSSSFIAAS